MIISDELNHASIIDGIRLDLTKIYIKYFNITSGFINSNFLILMSLQPDGINLWYFKHKHFDLTQVVFWSRILKTVHRRKTRYKKKIILIFTYSSYYMESYSTKSSHISLGSCKVLLVRNHNSKIKKKLFQGENGEKRRIF